MHVQHVQLQESALASRFRPQHVNTSVLSEMVIEGEGPSDVTGIEHGERDGVAEGPILVSVSSENLSAFLFFRGQHPHDRQSACQQPLTGDRPSELPYEECVRFRFDVVGDEAGARVGRDVTRHGDGTCMVRIVCIEQRENGA